MAARTAARSTRPETHRECVRLQRADGRRTKGDWGTRADGPCFDNTNRYVDCGNGTVTDTVTGLIWLQDADCLGFTIGPPRIRRPRP